jgi:hypothetical protein
MEQWRVVDAENGSVEAKMKGLYCRPVIANSHHLDEEQDPDPHQGGTSNPNTHQCERIRNTSQDPFLT